MSARVAQGVGVQPAAVRALLDGIVDYAGLFPPAGLAMSEAVRNYQRYLDAPESWMLGRFVVPAERLEELIDARSSLPAAAAPFRVSALVGPTSMASDLARIGMACREDPGLTIDSVEARLGGDRDDGAISGLAEAVGGAFALYVEIPVTEDPSPLLRAIAAANAHAKVRTGGTAPEVFPRSDELARFLLGCAEHRVAFKATAGLHHAIRGRHRLTYASNAPTGIMFGFLGVFVAAALARAGASEQEVRAVLEAEDANELTFDGSGASWRRRRLSTDALRDTRRTLARSFGSCSFEEPVQDLRALGLL